MPGINKSTSIRSGPNAGSNFKCLRPTISHMNLVAEFFYKQTQGVSAVPVVIHDENPQILSVVNIGFFPFTRGGRSQKSGLRWPIFQVPWRSRRA